MTTPTAPPPEAPPDAEGVPVESTQAKAPRELRKPVSLWMRTRLLLLFVVLWFIIVWAAMADNPLLPFVDSMRIQLVDSQWLIWLAGLELLRQVHYLVCEHWSRYNRFWTNTVFGGTNRVLRKRFTDWSRHRMATLLKVVVFVVLLAIVAGQVLGTSPVLAIFQAPALLYQALPLILQLLFAFFFVAFQFIGLFWLLSRGGMDTYYPDDITTRFSDV